MLNHDKTYILVMLYTYHSGFLVAFSMRGPNFPFLANNFRAFTINGT